MENSTSTPRSQVTTACRLEPHSSEVCDNVRHCEFCSGQAAPVLSERYSKLRSPSVLPSATSTSVREQRKWPDQLHVHPSSSIGRGIRSTPSTCYSRGCPSPDSYGRNCFAYVDQCTSNLACNVGEKCCLVAGCGRECVRVVPDVAPTLPAPKCPAASGNFGICVFGPNSCTSDAQCSGGKLCCPEGCGSECKFPVFG